MMHYMACTTTSQLKIPEFKKFFLASGLHISIIWCEYHVCAHPFRFWGLKGALAGEDVTRS